MSHTQEHTSLPESMKAIMLVEPGDDFVITQQSVPLPCTNSNELLVKVEYVALNPVDSKFATQGFCMWQYPHIMGLDAVGTVVQSERGLFPPVGTRVMWHANIGSDGVLSEYAAVPNYAVSVVPDNVRPSEAVVLPCAGMTALISLDKLQLSDGDTLFVDGGSGAVGHFAIQFAKSRGATVFATASKKHHKMVKQIGADAVFDYADTKLIDKIRKELGPQGFDAVIDTVGGDATIRNIELMRFCGRIACLNELPKFEQQLMFRRAPNIGIVSLGGAYLANSLCAQQHLSFMGNLLLETLASGDLKLPQIHALDFDAGSISEAMKQQKSGQFNGKFVIQVS